MSEIKSRAEGCQLDFAGKEEAKMIMEILKDQSQGVNSNLDVSDRLRGERGRFLPN